MTAALTAFLLTFMAELGDKTQFLMIAFASKMGIRPVLLGMTAGIVASMTFAVTIGSLVGNLIPTGVMKLIAALLFLGFGLKTLRGGADDDDEAVSGRKKLSPFWTVFTALFIGEMGDKTQLTAAVLAAESATPVFTWVGLTAGMLLADGLGVVVGAALSKRLSPRIMAYASATIFLFFGSLTLYRGVPAAFRSFPYVALYLVALAGLVWLVVRRPAAATASTTAD